MNGDAVLCYKHTALCPVLIFIFKRVMLGILTQALLLVLLVLQPTAWAVSQVPSKAVSSECPYFQLWKLCLYLFATAGKARLTCVALWGRDTVLFTLWCRG